MRTLIFMITGVIWIFANCSSTTNSKSHSGTRGKIEKTIKLSFGDISLRIDTFDISEDGNLKQAVIYHDKYYIMFETHRKNTTQTFKKMVVLDQHGDYVANVSVPNDFKNIHYYDISIENDSLLVKETEFEEYTFFLDEKGRKLRPIKKRKLKSYQDSDYNIYTMDHGEWGGTTYFQSKANKSVHKVEFHPNAINRIDSTYYLTHSKFMPWGQSSLLRISNPQLLQQSNLNFIHRSVDEELVGGEIIFNNEEVNIMCSFVIKKKLLHIYSDDQSTYIGEIVDNKIQPLYKFDFNFSAFQCMHYENGKQIYGCFIHDKKYEKWKNSTFMPFNDEIKQNPIYNKGAILIIDKDSIVFHELN